MGGLPRHLDLQIGIPAAGDDRFQIGRFGDHTAQIRVVQPVGDQSPDPRPGLLFVDQAGQGDRSRKLGSGVVQHGHGGQDGRQSALHVGGTTTEETAVGHIGVEGITVPSVADGDDVGMPQKEQPRPLPAGQGDEHIGSTGFDLTGGDLKSSSPRFGDEDVHGGLFGSPGVDPAGVDQLDRQGSENRGVDLPRGGAGRRLCHSATSRGGRGTGGRGLGLPCLFQGQVQGGDQALDAGIGALRSGGGEAEPERRGEATPG